ncbi:hypothetical protein XENTR_v10001600 [Xenopus tropicalis]|nr:hypothetical protein XENTR_v10001600 [Xenopus tropicalis]
MSLHLFNLIASSPPQNTGTISLHSQYLTALAQSSCILSIFLFWHNLTGLLFTCVPPNSYSTFVISLNHCTFKTYE